MIRQFEETVDPDRMATGVQRLDRSVVRVHVARVGLLNVPLGGGQRNRQKRQREQRDDLPHASTSYRGQMYPVPAGFGTQPTDWGKSHLGSLSATSGNSTVNAIVMNESVGWIGHINGLIAIRADIRHSPQPGRSPKKFRTPYVRRGRPFRARPLAAPLPRWSPFSLFALFWGTSG